MFLALILLSFLLIAGFNVLVVLHFATADGVAVAVVVVIVIVVVVVSVISPNRAALAAILI